MVQSVAGRRRALLVGCNYPGSRYKLEGCIRDVRMIKNTLEFQYQYEDILLLVVCSYPKGLQAFKTNAVWSVEQQAHSF